MATLHRLRLWLARLIAPKGAPLELAAEAPIAKAPIQPTALPAPARAPSPQKELRPVDGLSRTERRARAKDWEARLQKANQESEAMARLAEDARARARELERALEEVSARLSERRGQERGVAAREGREAPEPARRAHPSEGRRRAADDRAGALIARAEKAERELGVVRRELHLAQERERAVASRLRAHEGPAAASKSAGPRVGAPRAQSGVARVCFSPGEECLSTLREHIAGARRSIDACVFTITDDRLSRELIDAHHRGVSVRVLTDNDKSLDRGSDVRHLERAGIAVREDRTEFHMHHKFAVFDEELVITGSYNWTRGAAESNEENFVVSDDPRLVGPFLREFEALWQKLE